MMINNTVMAYFSSPLAEDDEHMLKVKIGDSAGQQAVEALAVLVALKLWRRIWYRPGISLRIRSDSVSTLTLLIKLRASRNSAGMSVVARELALEFGSSSYKPLLYQRIPGLSNDWADALSRLAQPGKHAQLYRCR